MDTESNEIRCTIKVNYVIYPKDTIGIAPGTWAVFSADIISIIDGAPITKGSNVLRVAGNVPSLDSDKTYNLTASLSKNKKYGTTYDVLSMNEVRSFSSKEEEKQFLKSIVSEKLVESMYNTLDNPIKAIKDKDISALCTVNGIQELTAERIVKKYNDACDDGPAYLELMKLGLSKLAIKKLSDQYSGVTTALDKIKENPYILIDEVSGIGWVKADTIAQRSGIEKFSKKRIMAYIKYYLKSRAEDGDSWVEVANVVSAARKELSITDEQKSIFKETVQMMNDKGVVWLSDNHRYIALSWVRKLEKNIAVELKRIASAPIKKTWNNIDESINDAENDLGIQYTEEQRAAIHKVISSNVSILTGLGGTGKTTVVAGVLHVLKDQSYAQTALSGRAAARMSEITSRNGYTIHRLLGYKPDIGFMHDKQFPLHQDVIILDETSMVGADLFHHLIQAIKTGGRLIMIGDDGQLESIGLCNIFKDMISSNVIAMARLTKIHRQAAKSAIITESIKVRNAVQLTPFGWAGSEIRGELKDLELDVYRNTEDSFTHIMKQFKQLYKNAGNDCSDIQIVLPQRFRGGICTLRLNTAVQEIVNPAVGQTQIEISYVSSGNNANYFLRIGDYVIITKNNYDTRTVDGVDCPVYNGNKGKIISIDIKRGEMVIDFEQWGKIVIPHFSKNQNIWNSVELAYALTCHKLQGSEAKYVIVGIDNSAHVMLTREWLYTAITRAKKYCVVCAESDALNYSIKTSNVPFKQTFLRSFLNEEFSQKSS